MLNTKKNKARILPFGKITLDDIPLVGGKNASLGEMIRELSAQGIRVPDGFAVTARVYREFLAQEGLDSWIKEELAQLDVHDIEDLRRRGKKIRDKVLATPLPEEVVGEITQAYEAMGGDNSVDVAVRSSATAEDLPDASFAGQQSSYLNVKGAPALMEACRKCIASLFTDRAISYREERGFDHEQVALSIGVQRMIRSDLASAGVIFTIDTETGFENVILITSAYGLGENVVQGAVNPDEFYVFKPTLKTGFKPLLQKSLGTKALRMIYDESGRRTVLNVPVEPAERGRFSLAEDEVLTLARWALLIEEHYSRRNGRFTPMDLEWGKDGRTGELFILQARPETVHSRRRQDRIEIYHLKEKSRVLAEGKSVGGKIATGPVRVIRDTRDLEAFQDGDVLVSDRTDPDWEPVMKRASAIVTNRGGRTCHAAIVSRELGLPAVVGTMNATEVLAQGVEVTVSCADGEVGKVLEGFLPFEIEVIEITNQKRPKTKIMMNVANPRESFTNSMIPNDGVGLAREEFIISNYIKAHPLALLDYEHLENADTRAEIDTLTSGYDDKAQFFVDRLAQGVAMIAAPFYPKDVIVRLSDFKSNEYAHLIGGEAYEPHEANPMIGFRGASRYYSESYGRAFELECQAMVKARNEMGLTNIKLMVPFCRTVEEGRRVIADMARFGLERGKDELEIYVMCEIPSNVVLADQFSQIFDGFSIGSNDLTQLTLGVDRDSELIADLFDERDESVLRMISNVIQTAKSKGRKIGICGQAPSDYPEFAAFLVKEGIDSISLTPDAVMRVTQSVLECEAEEKEASESV